MLKYNIYYRNIKVNKRPLSEKEINNIKSVKTINKYNENTKMVYQIPTSDIEIIKCYVI